jgi:hypothetical protein
MFPLAVLVFAALSPDVIFHLPQQDYTITFPAARGGCLSSVFNTETNNELIKSPLFFSGESAHAPTIDPCQNTTLRVLYQNATALAFTSSTSTSTTTMRVDLILQNSVIVISYSGLPKRNIAGSLTLNTPPNPIVPYYYTMDGKSVPALGTAQTSESVTLVSNWEMAVRVRGSEVENALHGTSEQTVAALPVCGKGNCCVVGKVDATANSTELTMGCTNSPFVIEFGRLI